MVGSIYLSPDQSGGCPTGPDFEQWWQALVTDIHDIQATGSFLLLGTDINGRTQEELDNLDPEGPALAGIIDNSPSLLPRRCNQDQAPVNKHGRRLVDFVLNVVCLLLMAL